MNPLDLEMVLQYGELPIYCGDIPIYGIKLSDMTEFGYTKYQQLIGLLCLDDEKTREYLIEDVTPSTFTYINAVLTQEFIDIENKKYVEKDIHNLLVYQITKLLTLLFRHETIFDFDNGFRIKIKDGKFLYLTKDNYNEFRDILKERNCLKNIDGSDDFNPSNDMARRLLEKRKQLQEKIKKFKQSDSDSDGLNIADLISIYADAKCIQMSDVYKNYDIYQFNNQFNRLKIMDDYQVNIRCLLAGAKKEDVNLKHWLSKINNKED